MTTRHFHSDPGRTQAEHPRSRATLPVRASARSTGLAALQADAGNAAVAQMLGQSGHPLSAGTTIQRVSKKKAPKNSKSAGEPAPKSDYEQALDYLVQQFPPLGKLSANAVEDILADAGVHAGGELVYSLEEIRGGACNEDISEEIQKSQYGPQFDVTGGGSSDWAAGSVSTAHKELRQHKDNQWGSDTSLHHKLSRSWLAELAKKAEGDPAARPFIDFVDEIRGDLNGSTASLTKVLQNIPANLEFGPLGEHRTDDPGAGFDFNRTASGSLTPRSAHLEKAGEIGSAAAIDWKKLADALREAQNLHRSTNNGALLSPPDKAGWQGAGHKWNKR
ncbi:hypothetical protein ACGF3J_06115 [Streptomyces sp. NPDC048171]|uniref:hypothetical protein n=1 Tax=unclassified Streptomyces TaxID=2593676 RepID=UPI00136CBB4A|nr:hypothetical protein [Streptomyces sp. SID5789]MZE74537.1 hypothetical protein [Streptomyces sp. SID5789]